MIIRCVTTDLVTKSVDETTQNYPVLYKKKIGVVYKHTLVINLLLATNFELFLILKALNLQNSLITDILFYFQSTQVTKF